MVSSAVWGVESWGPELVKRWRTIEDGQKRRVKAYEFEELPEAITQYPCALSFLQDNSCDIDYSQGGMNQAVWRGKTIFFLTGSIQKQSLSYVWQFYRKIVEAAAGKFTLDGKVESFVIKNNGSITLDEVTYGDESPKYGLSVFWEVCESLTNKITFGI